MDRAECLFSALCNNFGLRGAKGEVKFNLNDFCISVEQNNIIGNLLEEWLARWMEANNFPHIYNKKQESPDFWLNPDDLLSDWLEVKSFTGSPNFDIAAFRSFINIIIVKPWKLHSKFLLLKYDMDGSVVTIRDLWLKNLWEICSPSQNWPIKVQFKNKVIVNIRPAVWYSAKTDYPCFQSLSHFLSALEQTVYKYHETNYLSEFWASKLCDSYRAHFGSEFLLPRWNDIKHLYSPAPSA